MKKIIKTLALAAFTAAVFQFTSCQELIFSEIRNEVRLNDAEVSGDVYSLVRFQNSQENEILLASNGNIWAKDLSLNGSTTDWTKIAAPANVMQIYTTLAASQNEVYALTVNFEENESEGELEPTSQRILCGKYDAEGSIEWSEVSDLELKTDRDNGSKNILFCTNSVKKENRKAFANIGGAIYVLENASATKLEESGLTFKDNSSSSKSVSFFDGKYYFCDECSVTDETESSGAEVLYRASGSSVSYLKKGETAIDDDGKTVDAWQTVSIESISSIKSICAVSDALLFGTNEGLKMVSLSDKVPGTSLANLWANTSSALSTYYEVKNVLAVDPTKIPSEADLYASLDFEDVSSDTMAVFDSVGLWAYFPDRGNWNKE